MPRCIAVKADGSPCAAIVKESQQLCHAHDPARSEQRRQAASKAGKAGRTIGELASVKADLRQLARDVLEGEISTGKASVASQVLGVYLRAVEQERKQRELEELARELAELREIVDSRGDERGRAWG